MANPTGSSGCDRRAQPGIDERHPRALRAAEVLRRFRAGILQRQAAAMVEASARDPHALISTLRSQEHLGDPPCAGGPFASWVRRLGFRWFLQWHAHPLQQKQTRFNQAAATLLEELLDENLRLSQEVAQLRVRLRRLEGTSEE